jgi:serine/threonine protein phosphatase PrpC
VHILVILLASYVSLVILSLMDLFCLLDRFVIEHIGSTSKEDDNSKPISLLAVFDGHGGSAASQFCSDWLSSYIRKQNEHYPANIAAAVKSAFIRVSMCLDKDTMLL